MAHLDSGYWICSWCPLLDLVTALLLMRNVTKFSFELCQGYPLLCVLSGGNLRSLHFVTSRSKNVITFKGEKDLNVLCQVETKCWRGLPNGGFSKTPSSSRQYVP